MPPVLQEGQPVRASQVEYQYTRLQEGSLTCAINSQSSCLSSRGIHVFVLFMHLWTNDDIGISDVGSMFLLRSSMCLMSILVI